VGVGVGVDEPPLPGSQALTSKPAATTIAVIGDKRYFTAETPPQCPNRIKRVRNFQLNVSRGR
jgi:hypothetical protein